MAVTPSTPMTNLQRVTEQAVVHRWDVLDILSDRLRSVTGVEVGDFVDEVFDSEYTLSFGEFLEWCYAVSVGSIGLSDNNSGQTRNVQQKGA